MKTQVKKLYEKNLNACRKELELIKKALENYEVESSFNPHYGHVGDLSHTLTELSEIRKAI